MHSTHQTFLENGFPLKVYIVDWDIFTNCLFVWLFDCLCDIQVEKICILYIFVVHHEKFHLIYLLFSGTHLVFLPENHYAYTNKLYCSSFIPTYVQFIDRFKQKPLQQQHQKEEELAYVLLCYVSFRFVLCDTLKNTFGGLNCTVLLWHSKNSSNMIPIFTHNGFSYVIQRTHVKM